MLASLLMLPGGMMAQVNSLLSQPHLLVKGPAQKEVTPDRFFVKINFCALDL
ncbi:MULTISPECIES: hypothetical protein [Xanthomonas]|uniref:Uncharacterized protein n=1 Tax=Xanthomonas hortorum pv. hederae TaxID=453603 RepID=A0A9X3YZW4_9XANT|nr:MULTISPECIES: hypothetical protein [Xanthomonas]MCE4372420.1 hypothetical protein [Xanthomonas hortorum pv. hederae]MDC8637675.1 hypothetical protein [Xanthomonas hortorum pv. hederae]UOS99650.1 hypothetical protein LZZ50_04565 [Xanthomonas arboricola]